MVDEHLENALVASSEKAVVNFSQKNQLDLEQVVSTNKTLIYQDEEDATAYYNLGSAYFYQKKYNHALACLKRSVRLRPDHSNTYNNLGSVYQRIGKEHQAVQAYKKAIRLGPDLPSSYYNLGSLFYGKDDFDKAFENYAKTIELDPEQAMA